MDELNNIIAESEDGTQGKYLTFAVGTEEYGIEISVVVEIISIQNITEVPELPNYIKGIINLRGKIIPVLDVRTRFGKEEKDYDDRTCIIVIELGDTTAGLIVDTVLEVLNISEDQIAEPPESRTGFRNNYVKGIGKTAGGVKLILDCDKLISDGAIIDPVLGA